MLDECVNGITLADPNIDDIPIMYANKDFLTMTGYSEQEIIGRNCHFLQEKQTSPKWVAAIRESIRTRQPSTIDIVNYRKNGEMFINRVKIKPLYDNDGSLIYVMGFQEDLSIIKVPGCNLPISRPD